VVVDVVVVVVVLVVILITVVVVVIVVEKIRQAYIKAVTLNSVRGREEGRDGRTEDSVYGNDDEIRATTKNSGNKNDVCSRCRSWKRKYTRANKKLGKRDFQLTHFPTEPDRHIVEICPGF